MPDCCGQNRKTKFCPDCGHAVAASVVDILVRRFRTQAGAQRKRAEGNRKKLPDNKYAAKWVASNEKHAAVFDGWADELVRLAGWNSKATETLSAMREALAVIADYLKETADESADGSFEARAISNRQIVLDLLAMVESLRPAPATAK